MAHVDPRLMAEEAPVPHTAGTGPATPCVHCRRWRVFLGGMLMAAIGLALHATAGPPLQVPKPAERRASVAPPAASQPASSAAPTVKAVPAPEAVTYPLAAPEPAPVPPPVAAPAPPPIEPKVQPPATRAQPDLRLVYVTVPLPAGRINTPYKPREVVRGGQPPYRIEIEGDTPPGLIFDAKGLLSGTPTKTGNYSFTLRAEDSAVPSTEQEQHYVLRILDPLPAAAVPRPAVVASAPVETPKLVGLSTQEADGRARGSANTVLSYLLTADKLKELLPEGEDDKPSGKATPLATAPTLPALGALRADLPETEQTPLADPPMDVPQAPTAGQLRDILTPLLGIEYPTRVMFIRAVETERCRYYLRRVREIADDRHLPAPTACPPPNTPRSANAPLLPKPNQRRPANSAVTLNEFYDSLMSDQNLVDIVAAAQREHVVENARPLAWTGEGCQCAPDHKDNQVVGMIPFWSAPQQRAPLDFSLYTRLQYLGAVLDDSGQYLRPNTWPDVLSGFSREAQRHDVAMDLVLYRREWTRLLNRSGQEREILINTAVANAMAMVDQENSDTQSLLNHLMLSSSWRESNRMFSGLTLFFEDIPTDTPGLDRFGDFMHLFVDALVEAMQARGQPYYLNIVVPDQLMNEKSPYSYDWLMRVKLKAESSLNPRHRAESAATPEGGYEGKTDITVKFLVMLSGDPDVEKKELRRRIDRTPQLHGVRRIDFLDSVLPVVVHATAPEETTTPNVAANMTRDFPYIEWTYGGITLWPLPQNGVGMGGEVTAPLARFFTSGLSLRQTVCGIVCANRALTRLVSEFAILTWTAAALLYFLNCAVRRSGRMYLAALWIGGVVTAVLVLAMVGCDPAFASLRDNQSVLYGALAVLAAISGVLVFKPDRQEI